MSSTVLSKPAAPLDQAHPSPPEPAHQQDRKPKGILKQSSKSQQPTSAENVKITTSASNIQAAQSAEWSPASHAHQQDASMGMHEGPGIRPESSRPRSDAKAPAEPLPSSTSPQQLVPGTHAPVLQPSPSALAADSVMPSSLKTPDASRNGSQNLAGSLGAGSAASPTAGVAKGQADIPHKIPQGLRKGFFGKPSKKPLAAPAPTSKESTCNTGRPSSRGPAPSQPAQTSGVVSPALASAQLSLEQSSSSARLQPAGASSSATDSTGQSAAEAAFSGTVIERPVLASTSARSPTTSSGAKIEGPQATSQTPKSLQELVHDFQTGQLSSHSEGPPASKPRSQQDRAAGPAMSRQTATALQVRDCKEGKQEASDAGSGGNSEVDAPAPKASRFKQRRAAGLQI